MNEERIAKLPVWAQSHIENLQRERDVAVRELREWSDNQTESPFFVQELVCTGENGLPPSWFTRYIQSHKVSVSHAGVDVAVYAADGRVEIRYGASKRGMSDVAIVAKARGSIDLVAKENL